MKQSREKRIINHNTIKWLPSVSLCGSGFLQEGERHFCRSEFTQQIATQILGAVRSAGIKKEHGLKELVTLIIMVAIVIKTHPDCF